MNDQVFEQARRALQQHLIDYIQDRPQSIKDSDGWVRHLFDAPLAQQFVPLACRDLVTAISRHLDEEDQP